MSASHAFNWSKIVLTLGVGAGFLFGGAGFYIYHYLVQRKHTKHMQQEMAKLHSSISKLQRDFYELRNSEHLNCCKKKVASSRHRKRSLRSLEGGNETEDDMFSTVNTDDDEEFYDLNSDDEEMVLRSISEENGNKNNEESNKLLEEVDILLKGNDEDRLNAFNLLKKNEYDLSESPDFLWRFAKAHQIQATKFGALNDMESKKKYVYEGLEYAEKALALDSTNPDAHKWFAILIGMQGDFVSIKQKIQNGYLFQKHVLIALENKPDDYSLHHLLARFKFEVANTSWIEKKIASSIFSEIPSVTFADAISDLHTAEELSPAPWKENRLLLAKCYIGDGKYEKALEWLDSAKELTPHTEEEQACDLEIDTLRDKYKKYRK